MSQVLKPQQLPRQRATSAAADPPPPPVLAALPQQWSTARMESAKTVNEVPNYLTFPPGGERGSKKRVKIRLHGKTPTPYCCGLGSEGAVCTEQREVRGCVPCEHQAPQHY